MVTPTEAARLILEHIAPLPAARRPLREVLDRVLAEDVTSPIDLPAWDNSAMDGYAARAVDVERARPDHKIALAVIEAVAAGQFPTRPLGPGQVTRIFTGAPLPAGADTVVRQEDTEPAESGSVKVVTGRDARKNIRRRGEDIRKGDVVLGAGSPLGPAQLGVLASIAHATPLVHDAPRVAFMGSGDEIVDLGLARDTKESLREHLAGATRSSDLLVTTAGVSVGEHDFVREVLTELGGEIKLWRIAMRPGAPVGFGLLGGKPWIGLPGNPVSVMVTFELFVRPAMRRLLGHPLPFRRTVPVCVGEPIKLGPKLRHFLRAVVQPEGSGGGALTARLTGPQGSGILTSMARAN